MESGCLYSKNDIPNITACGESNISFILARRVNCNINLVFAVF